MKSSKLHRRIHDLLSRRVNLFLFSKVDYRAMGARAEIDKAHALGSALSSNVTPYLRQLFERLFAEQAERHELFPDCTDAMSFATVERENPIPPGRPLPDDHPDRYKVPDGYVWRRMSYTMAPKMLCLHCELRNLADLADRFGGGRYLITTRARDGRVVARRELVIAGDPKPLSPASTSAGGE